MNRRGRSAGRVPGVVLLILLAAASCGRTGSSEIDQATFGGSVASTQGREISLSGRVTATYGARVFAVGSGASRVIVVTVSPVAVSVGRQVEATGSARRFARRELESQLGVDLGPEVDDLENSRCLLATVAQAR